MSSVAALAKKSSLQFCLLMAFSSAVFTQEARVYQGKELSRIAFPVGGIGAGNFAVEGSGAISQMSVRNIPDFLQEPLMFAAIHLEGTLPVTKVLEGPVRDHKIFGMPGSGSGILNLSWGLPRFEKAAFKSTFPFAAIELTDSKLPLRVNIEAWSPFIPTDADNSSLPVGALEYTFVNTSGRNQDYTFTYSCENFLASRLPKDVKPVGAVRPLTGGFNLHTDSLPGRPDLVADFAVVVDEPQPMVDHCWFRGGWFDPLTMAWNDIAKGEVKAKAPVHREPPFPYHLAWRPAHKSASG